MAILTKHEIINAIKSGELIFEPNLDEFQLQPTGIDIRVGYNFYIPKVWTLKECGRTELCADHLDDEKKNEVLDCIRLKPGQTFELLPGEFILISTLEKVNLKSGKYLGMLFPRSSTIRRGLSVESGLISPYFEGFLTIPIVNQTKTQNIKIYPGERIAQIVFQTLEHELKEIEALSHGNIKSKYQDAQSYQLGYKFDPHDEITLIKDGEVNKMKKKYNVIQEDDDDETPGKDKGKKDDSKENKLPLSS